MAEIPVERKEKSGFPWWLIPLILLLLLLPLLYFCSNRADNTNTNVNRALVNGSGNAANANNYAASSNANNSANRAGINNGANNSGTGGVMNGNGSGNANNSGAANSNGANTGGNNSGASINDVNYFGTATDKSALVGRRFSTEGARVNRVLSDKVFTVKSGSGEMFVMLDDNLDTSGGKEKQIRMRPGQVVNLGGDFRNVPTGETKEENKEGGLNKNEYAQMKGQQVYLHANSVSDAK